MAAQNEARAANNDQIRPEHLVLGLLTEPEAIGAQAIIAQGVSLNAVRQTVIATLLLMHPLPPASSRAHSGPTDCGGWDFSVAERRSGTVRRPDARSRG
ncbi:MAG TPA: Clp protease N-terminal domain-containing protein [Pseudonocardiaceae bacterium]|nr:Clp protease N-terminal domain-containing protein [Pseudonocardiaceae bacterium]